MSIVYTPESKLNPRNHTRKIYVSYSMDDMNYFDAIEADIRGIERDCVIAKRIADGDRVGEAHFEEVLDFHLVVIPITVNWFKDGIHREEFERLIKKHKTILPILYESECETHFNTMSGNLQFLRSTDADYKEKLKRNLKDILVDQELVERVEKVFTCKMFIGYCREDYAYTQELVRCIHAEESGRRIAIWYDKYLPTGKNFEHSIFQQLDSSQIVGINTTPNLISRENYVKEKEFPRAKKGKKTIIFFEMAQTKNEDVRAYFGVGDAEDFEIVPVRRGHRFSSYIETRFNLKEAGKRTRFRQDETDCLLGYAYLNGLFVEFDSEYALKKFKRAAMAENSDAANQLGNMYYYGIGVEREFSKALDWYEEEAKIVERAYRRAFVLLKEAKSKLLSKVKEADLNLIGDYTCALREVFERYTHCARISRDEGDFKRADRYYRKNMDLIEEAEANFNRLEIIKKLQASNDNELHLMQLIYGVADIEDLMKQFISNVEAYEASSQDEYAIHAVAMSGHTFGGKLLECNMIDEALTTLLKTFKISSQGETLSETKELLIVICRDIGKCYIQKSYDSEKEQQENADEALKWLHLARVYLQESKSLSDNPYFRFLDVLCDVYIGEAYALKEKTLGLSWLFEALSELRSVEQELGENAFVADYPLTVLQHYYVIFNGIYLCRSALEETQMCDIFNDIRDVVKRYKAIRYHSDFQSKAETYIHLLEQILSERFE